MGVTPNPDSWKKHHIYRPQAADLRSKQTEVEITTVTLWNDKSYDFTNNCLPKRAWRHQPNQPLNKVSDGRRPELLLNASRTVLNLRLHPIIYMELFHANM